MHPRRKRKLKTILLILAILGIAVALVLYSLRQNISLFYSPTQLATETVPAHQVIRVGGVVVPGSVIRSTNDDLMVRFKVTDYQHSIEVTYRGILPDLFREGQGIVTRGQLLDNQHFQAVEVLAKHDEKYMPPEVKDTLKKAHV
ncbi:MAG: cytochrome c maturation protein CcmE [Legionellaceae bacterium]|nr:cytochrome c maturation protein CcmE [Legionellaceae bacterium]